MFFPNGESQNACALALPLFIHPSSTVHWCLHKAPHNEASCACSCSGSRKNMAKRLKHFGLK
jgi:hypothetical protein